MGYKFNPLPWRFDRTGGGAGSGSVVSLTGDSGGPVGPDGAGNIDILGNPDIDVVGTPGTNSFQLTNLTKLSPYIVCATDAPYSTIQSALDAATGAGGGIVFVCPGTYTEDLTLYGDTQVIAIPGNSDAATSGNTVIIVGDHTPPSLGSFLFKSINLQSATDIFSSAVAGTATLILENCLVSITNGFTFNIPNWTGDLVTYNVGDTSTNNGMVNNTGGSTCFFVSATQGAGTGQTMVTSGTVTLQEVDLNCPWDAQTGSVIAADYVIFTQAVTLSNDSSGTFNFCRWDTGASTPLTMSSSGNFDIINCTFDSSADPYLAGSGSGSLILENITTLDNYQIGPSVETPALTYSMEGTGQTVNTATADLITYELHGDAACYNFSSVISGIAATGSIVAVRLSGTIKTTGAAASIVGAVDQNIDAELAISGASATFALSGNSVIVRATGSLGAVINWAADASFKLRHV